MCLQPIKVVNPYYDKESYQYVEGRVQRLDRRFVSSEQYIDVPCGKCSDCLNSFYLSLTQRMQMEALTSYVYMVTLTYDNDHIPSIQFRLDDGSVESLYYSDVSHVQNMFKRIRNRKILGKRDFRYVAATEYGSQRFRPHHHILLFVSRLDDDSPSTPITLRDYLFTELQKYYGRNVGTRKDPIYEKYFTYYEDKVTGRRTYDVQLVVDKDMDVNTIESINSPESISKVSAYVLTYINKPSRYESAIIDKLDELQKTLPLDIYRKLCQVLKSRCYFSKHFGFGFSNGSRVQPSLRCCGVSEQLKYLSQQVRILPDTFEELEWQQPEYAQQLLLFRVNFFDLARQSKFYRCPLNWFVSTLDAQSYFDFFCACKYFPKFDQYAIKCLDSPSVTWSPRMLPKSSYDSSFENSVTYKTIRKMIDRGIQERCSFLAFEYYYKGSLRFAPLCKYFRRYCTTFKDVERLYDSLGIVDFDDYMLRIKQNEHLFTYHLQAQQNNDDRCERNHIEQSDDTFLLEKVVEKKILPIFAPTVAQIVQNLI